MRGPVRVAVPIAVALATLGSLARAAEPSADRIQAAAEEFDTGRRAYLAGDYSAAAMHFENAYHDAPRPEPLRSAIRARRAAKDDALAATLASLAAARYASDPATLALAKEVLDALSGQLLGVRVACNPECSVAVDGRAVSLEDARETRLFVAPGKHALLVSWEGDRSTSVNVDGVAGGTYDVRLDAPRPAPSPVATPPGETRPSMYASVPRAAEHAKPLGPAVFIAGASLTAIALGATIISGVVATNDPGTAAVRRDCVGQGMTCPEYQRGIAGELRTNVLLGTTIGVGVITVAIGVFFTHWGHTRAGAAVGPTISPYASIAPGAFDVGLTLPL